VIPDYETSDVLYLTGSATILVGEAASSLLARTKLAIKLDIHDSRMVKRGLSFRGSLIDIDYSPYNPPLRLLHAEHDSRIAGTTGSSSTGGTQLTATLLAREHLTPTIARFTFQLSARPDKQWSAGEYVTLDFSEELDNGYAHMNDGDPQSLNDDYIRTFTVSSAPPTGQVGDGDKLEITARKHGPATGLLWRHNLRVPLELPVLGFGGEETFRMPAAITTTTSNITGAKSVFIAAGVGVTPLLAQASGVLSSSTAGSGLEVLWTVRREDLPLVKDSFERIEGLSAVTRLFLTAAAGGDGTSPTEEEEEEEDAALRKMGAGKVERRRINAGDVAELKNRGSKFFLCTGPVLLGLLSGWLEGEDVVWEDFGY
jgi:ferredoxin-NADP reductase